jgi:hypothetical protein
MTQPKIPEEVVVEAVVPDLPDETNPAINDAHRTFVITVWTIAAFIAGAVFIILRTRLGG